MFGRICLVSFVLTIVGCGCYRDHTKDPVQKWTNIHRLFMNESHSYTFMIKDSPEDKEFGMIQVTNWTLGYRRRASPRIIEDVRRGELMWATAKVGEYSDGSYYYDMEIHIHAAEDIEPGGWEKMEGKILRKGQNALIK